MSPTLKTAMGSMGRLTAQLGTVALAAGGVASAFSSVNKAMDFESQMSSIKALTGASSTEMKQMSDLALEMGAATKYSALEAGQGIEELLKAGLSPATVKAGGLEAALNLATAGGLGLAEAAEIMSTSLNAYKADSMTAAQASDILAGTANASATGVSDLRFSLAAVSAVAAGVGMTFKDTNIALGLFANNGLKGSDAGTSLKTMLMNLQPTTDDQIELFKRLGIVTKNGANQFYTAQGKLKSLEEISGTLHNALGGLTDQQRMLALETMFGSDAIRAANILYKEGAEGVNSFHGEMSKVTALDVAKEKMNNAKGAIEQFRGAMETLQIAALTPTLPLIKNVALAAADFTSKLSDWFGSDQATAWGERLRDGMMGVKSLFSGESFFAKAGFSSMLGPGAVKGVSVVVDLIMQLRATFISMAETVKPYIMSMAETVVSNLDKLKPAFSVVTSLYNTFADTVMAVYPIIADVFNTVFPIAASLVEKLSVAIAWLIEKVVRPLIPVMAQVIKDTWNLIKPIFEMMNTAIDEVSGAITSMIDGFSKVGDSWNNIASGNFSIGMPEVFGGSGIIQMNEASPKTDGSHYSGLNYVPRDGYVARLHQGERVMTARENRETSVGGSGGSPNITINVSGTVVREEADIDKIMRSIVRELAAGY
ncbi:phage tail tape measure protein [Brevibacillus laterosporus]|nr:phage tail tape measure protein [Brevibacillus laterosporus]